MEHGAGCAMSGCRLVFIIPHEISTGQTVSGNEKAAVSFGKDWKRHFAVSGFCSNGRLPRWHGEYSGRGYGNIFRRTGRCVLDVVHRLYRSKLSIYGIFTGAGV